MVNPDAADVKERWLKQAFANAKIDPSRWIPSKGAHANRHVIEAVYRYYARLCLAHAQLRWAAMAALVGPSFYAGFLDIDSVPGHLLRFFETSFLEMQRQIFEDQAVMHEAYLTDGLAGIQGLADAGIVDSATQIAWQQIESGEPQLVDAGNLALLFREQHDIIDRFYVGMREHSGGEAFTFAITAAGRPSIPGARPYSAVFPLTASARPLADWTVAVATPLPDGSIANFGDRWALIQRDTFPALLRFLNDAARARRLLEERISHRVRRFLLVARAGQLAVGLVTRWRVRISSASAQQQRSSGAATLTDRVPLRVNLRRPPRRGQIGVAEPDDFQSWTYADHRNLAVIVLLPQGREFRADTQLVTVTGLAPSHAPGRLIVKLPPVDRDQTFAALKDYSGRWGIDIATVMDWYERPRSAQLGHAYSTRIFQGESLGFVTLEFQVEHHVSADVYVIDAIFSWGYSPQSAPTGRSAKT